MDDVAKSRADHSLVWSLATKVQAYCPGPIGWIARQNDDERDDVYGFVVGKGFAHTTIEEATTRQNDDTYIRELATQILGYPPGSEPDLLRQQAEADEVINSLYQQINSLMAQLGYWNPKRVEAASKLAELRQAHGVH